MPWCLRKLIGEGTISILFEGSKRDCSKRLRRRTRVFGAVQLTSNWPPLTDAIVVSSSAPETAWADARAPRVLCLSVGSEHYLELLLQRAWLEKKSVERGIGGGWE